ncbi:response regulator [Pelagicoccus albus]|uniref:Response regulator transcription factor n=1 Tax=Pelagicoccus albus TaxID=415222 RepID=A0A7X1E8C4_9BACT|nr:response regulator transcription factor [Pelagicoccus albus]MBC2606126.1 response regulator transcription factor [Pelagicoccus albus]
MSIKVSIVEDNSDLCEELSQTIDSDPALNCISVSCNVQSALEDLPKANPDVVLMDIRLPDGSGIELVETLQPKLPHAQFVMLSLYKDSKNVLDALSSGAIGYLTKDSSRSEITQAIHAAHAGESPLSGAVARKVINNIHLNREKPRYAANLSAREREVMEQVALGKSDKQIGATLHISLPTVNTHLKRIFSKLEVHSRAEAISRYFMGKS